MTKNFLIKIKFTDYFFFGQGSEDKGKFGNSANYFLHSNLFPQQTGVRGFLRYLLLQLNSCLNPAGGPIPKHLESMAARLIGENSGINTNSGMINSISPIFIFKENTPLYYRPNEFIEQCPKHYIPVLLKKISGKTYPFIQRNTHEEVLDAYLLENYSSKQGFAEGFTDEKNNFLPCESIYKKHLIAGNRINYDGTPDDESYYKQEFLHLNDPFTFGLWAEFTIPEDKEIKIPENDLKMFSTFGKEQKEVFVSFKEQAMPDLNTYITEAYGEGSKILLLSDAMVGQDFDKHCIYASNLVTPFRFITTSVKDNDYAGIGKSNWSTQPFMLKRGSVLYLKNSDTAFLENETYKKIGYNYFIKIKNT